MSFPDKLPSIMGSSLLKFVSNKYKLSSLKLKAKQPVYDFVDFFAGCGGMSYGFFALANKYNMFRHLGAFDFDKHANSTYERNYGEKPYQADLSAIEIEEIIETVNNNKNSINNPLVVIGCAPCQGFSSHRKKDSRKDLRNTYVGIFADIAVALKADIVIMENVPDLLAEKHWHHYQVFKDILESNNYSIAVDILNFATYGVPQERFRTVLIASKKFIPTLPEGILARSNFRTVRNAIEHLPPLVAGECNKDDKMHVTSKHRKETVKLLSQIPKDGGFRPVGLGPACLDRVAGFSDVYGRLFWDKPAVTITARCRTPSCGRFTHPEQNRGLSVREAALLQGFPENFIFEGPFDDKYKQIGNAVPPMFSTVLALHVVSMLLGKNHGSDSNRQYITKPVAKSYSSVIAVIKQKASLSDKKEAAEKNA